MSAYLRLRAVPPPALRNSPAWLERQFDDGGEAAARYQGGRHREEVLDERYPDQERIYAGAFPHRIEDGPRAQVVLGGRPLLRPRGHEPHLRVLTAAQTRRVAGFLATAEFDALWLSARDALLPRYGGPTAEPETRGAFAAVHRELRTFYARTAECGDAVVKWLPARRVPVTP
ncbi:DUF1877 family protein [Streptomyces sp. NPDC013455]|uniref:DUF1877 family protein n=1 Tax=Streptomyces sp. NPDC013455 TaxID=3155605 RepID=UPI0034112646